MKDILIHLTGKQRRKLLRSVSHGSEIYAALNDASELPGFIPGLGAENYIAVCDAAGAEALLKAARSDCPEAVENIELASIKALRMRRLCDDLPV
jgi:hypothetical protein